MKNALPGFVTPCRSSGREAASCTTQAGSVHSAKDRGGWKPLLRQRHSCISLGTVRHKAASPPSHQRHGNVRCFHLQRCEHTRDCHNISPSRTKTGKRKLWRKQRRKGEEHKNKRSDETLCMGNTRWFIFKRSPIPKGETEPKGNKSPDNKYLRNTLPKYPIPF